jgi:cytoskeletal protein RodZ
MENIGAKLKDKRQEKKLSLEEISKRTKIQKHILEALEQGKAEEILGPVYAKSFLKKYALFLGVKPPEILKEGSPAHPVLTPVLTVSQKRSKAKILKWQRLILVIKSVVIILIIVICAVLLVKVIRLMHHSLLSSSKKKVKIEKTIRTPVSSTSTVPAVKKVTPQPPSSPTKIIPSRLVLRTKKDVWVQVKVDNCTVFEGFLKRSSQEEWAFEKEMHLWLGNAAFVELTLNGKYYGSPGKGVIKDIVVTKEGIKIK